MLTWNASFETGSQLVDSQHKILFDKINALEKLIQKPNLNKAEVDSFVEFLASYVANHFKFEEMCMLQHKCPAHAENKTAHAALIATLTAWKKEYDTKGATKEVLTKLHSVASSWIQNHIMKIDIQLRPCMKH